MGTSRILLIDDDQTFTTTVKLVLENKGYEVHVAASADAAMKQLDGGVKPDAMILDVLMSGRAEGILFARSVRKHEAHKGIPILMLTGMRGATGFGPVKDDPRDPVFLPVDEFLEKPVLPETLLSKLEKVLRKKA
jgi:DNA-binding response OmpR family regulator